MKSLYILLVTVTIFLSGCTAGTTPTDEQKPAEATAKLNFPNFESTLVPKSGESVYYVVLGSVDNETVVNIRYFAPSEALIGSRPWSVGQKCISWDASYDWMSSNVKTSKYTVGLISNNDVDISITDTFITKNKQAFDDYKQDNC